MSLDSRIELAIQEAAARAAVDGGFNVSLLKPNTLLSVVTKNSVYRIVVINPAKGELAIDGGILPEPHLFQLIGSTFGGSITKVGWIGAGMYLKCYGFQTSTVQSVKIENNADLAARMVEQAKENTVVLTEEQAEDGLKTILREKITDTLMLREVEESLKGFSINGKLAIGTFLARAQEWGKLPEALEALKEMSEETFDLQHPQMRGDPNIGNNANYIDELYARASVPKREKSKR